MQEKKAEIQSNIRDILAPVGEDTMAMFQEMSTLKGRVVIDDEGNWIEHE